MLNRAWKARADAAVDLLRVRCGGLPASLPFTGLLQLHVHVLQQLHVHVPQRHARIDNLPACLLSVRQRLHTLRLGGTGLVLAPEDVSVLLQLPSLTSLDVREASFGTHDRMPIGRRGPDSAAMDKTMAALRWVC
jgi:hypothetical protein